MVMTSSHRLRRLRQSEAFRALVRETRLSAEQLVMPLFVRAGKNVRAQIPSMPGQFQLSVDQLLNEAQDLHAHGVPAVLLLSCTTTITVALPPLVTVPRSQGSAVQPPWLDATETSVTPTGRVSVTVTVSASDRPTLWTLRV